MGFEVVEGQQENLPTMQTLGAVKQEPLECFIHDCKLEKCTSQSGWEYVRCPMSDCFIFTGLDKVHHYLKIVQDQIPVWYKLNKEKLKCFCSQSLVLCQSCSEKNLGRMYFRCQRNRCNFFQWGDEIPSGKNMIWIIQSMVDTTIVLETIGYCPSRLLIGYWSFERALLLMSILKLKININLPQLFAKPTKSLKFAILSRRNDNTQQLR